MNHTADVSGAFQRPTLVDYLMVAEHQELDLSLLVHVGKLEIGVLGVRGGQLEHAQMPGATGDAAASLLLRMSNARVSPEQVGARTKNVRAPWRQLVDEALLANSPGRAQRLAQVRAELRELEDEIAAQSGVHELPVPERPPSEARSMRVATELLDWAVLEAYLAGETEKARLLAGERERLSPGELLAAANLERLRLRLLEDEIAAGVAEVKE